MPGNGAGKGAGTVPGRVRKNCGFCQNLKCQFRRGRGPHEIRIWDFGRNCLALGGAAAGRGGHFIGLRSSHLPSHPLGGPWAGLGPVYTNIFCLDEEVMK